MLTSREQKGRSAVGLHGSVLVVQQGACKALAFGQGGFDSLPTHFEACAGSPSAPWHRLCPLPGRKVRTARPAHRQPKQTLTVCSALGLVTGTRPLWLERCRRDVASVGVAQRAERRPMKPMVDGSSPSSPFTDLVDVVERVAVPRNASLT